MRCTLGAALLCLAGVPVAGAADPPLVEKQWQVDGVARKALVFVPAGAKEAVTRHTLGPLIRTHGWAATAVRANMGGGLCS